MANGRCRMHGGKALIGVAVPGYKEGRYSRYMPKGLLTIYNDARRDEKALELGDEIALIDSRVADVLLAMRSGSGVEVWFTVKELSEQLGDALSVGDLSSIQAIHEELSEVVKGKFKDDKAWSEVAQLTDSRRKLVESQRKREIELRAMMPVGDVMAIGRLLIEAVRKTVTDANQLSTIQQDFSRVIRGVFGERLDSRPSLVELEDG